MTRGTILNRSSVSSVNGATSAGTRVAAGPDARAPDGGDLAARVKPLQLGVRGWLGGKPRLGPDGPQQLQLPVGGIIAQTGRWDTALPAGGRFRAGWPCRRAGCPTAGRLSGYGVTLSS
jgi:hypothetical protein